MNRLDRLKRRLAAIKLYNKYNDLRVVSRELGIQNKVVRSLVLGHQKTEQELIDLISKVENKINESPVPITKKIATPMLNSELSFIEWYSKENKGVTPLFLIKNHNITLAMAGRICSKLQTLNP